VIRFDNLTAGQVIALVERDPEARRQWEALGDEAEERPGPKCGECGRWIGAGWCERCGE